MYYSLSAQDHVQNFRKTVGALSPRTMGVDIRYVLVYPEENRP